MFYTNKISTTQNLGVSLKKKKKKKKRLTCAFHFTREQVRVRNHSCPKHHQTSFHLNAQTSCLDLHTNKTVNNRVHSITHLSTRSSIIGYIHLSSHLTSLATPSFDVS